METITCKERKLIHDGTSLRFYADLMETESGYTEVWDRVEHKFNASAVVPVLPNGDIILVSQLRPAAGRMTWEIPAGKRDDEGREDPFICAKRELKEETGFNSNEIEHIMTLRPAIAYSTETIDMYVAKNAYPDGEQHLDPSEFINVKTFSIKTLLDMVKNGEIQDAKTVIGILYALNLFRDSI